MSRCYAYIVAYISRLEIGNVVLRPARLEVGHYDIKVEVLRSTICSTCTGITYYLYNKVYRTVLCIVLE